MPRFYLGRPRGLVALLGVAIGLTALVGAQAPAIDPTQADRFTAQIVVSLLEHGHLSKPRVNDEIAQKWARLFIKALDPQKLYFEKPDLEAFLAEDLTLDDQIRRGNIDFATAVFQKYLQRHDERLATILDQLKQKCDFTIDESIVDDPDLYDYPADAKEAGERWRKQIKYELLTKKILKVDEAEALEQLRIRYRDLNRYFHQFDTTDLLERYLTSLTMAVDPHSSYMGSKTLEDLMGQQLHLSLEGIGASLSVEDGFPIVKEIVPGGAADKDGRLEPEDKIVGVEEEEGGKVIDFVEKKLSDVVRIIRGPRGTKIRLIVQPSGSKERKVYELTREKIELKDSHAKGQVIESKGVDGKPLKIGVIDLPSFYGDTAAVRRGDPDAVSATQDCRAILEGYKKQGIDVVLIDLRRNGGGLLLEAITLSGLFIDTGPVVQVRDPESITHHDDDEAGTAWDGPMAVLISHYSASASEIFAGVIKDYGRGLIVGDSSTYGKGTVQSIVPLNERLRRLGDDVPNLGALKLTIQQFYRANGESTQVRGVPPDVHIPSFLDQAEHLGEGKMDNALKFDKIPPLPHDQYNRVPSELVAQLNTRSKARRQESEKFRKQQESIQKLVDRKTRHAIALNEEKFRTEFVPGDDEEDEEVKPKGKPKRRPEHLAWESNFYNDEIMAIVSDYVSLGAKALTAAPVRAANVAASSR